MNWTNGSLADAFSLMGFFVLGIAPTLSLLLSYATDKGSAIDLSRGVTGLVTECLGGVAELKACAGTAAQELAAVGPTMEAARFLGCFFALAALFDKLLPGEVKTGPVTRTGHVPEYVDNALLHCVLFSLCFVGGSSVGLGLYDLGVIYDVFPSSVLLLNALGFALAGYLNWKGLHAPSTGDSGTTGSWLNDFKWGTELYPRVLGLDVKRFVNCRVSMTLWQLAGVSFAYKSYVLHGELDYGLVLSALSQYLYLFKFFVWEIGYMRSIDIIVDRAGFEIQWGCLVWVPAIYTLHSRMSVLHPSGLSLGVAAVIFATGLAGVALNYYADDQRMKFREADGKMLIRGRKARYIEARYTVNGKSRTSLLLADGMWGPARHFHYVFELMAAWSWCALANPVRNGFFTCGYAFFLTLLLAHRAKRDEIKCLAKYGDGYRKLMKLVPYRMVPGVY